MKPHIYVWKSVIQAVSMNFLSMDRVANFQRGSYGEVDRASDFHFNFPGFKSRFGHKNFSSTFHYFCNFGTIRTLIW
jgi:hypothetical protein